MSEIRKIEVLSLAKIIALVWFFLGLILGVVLFNFILGNILVGIPVGIFAWHSDWLGIGEFILMLFMLVLIRFYHTPSGSIFLQFAGLVGRIRVELDRDEEKTKMVVSQ